MKRTYRDYLEDMLFSAKGERRSRGWGPGAIFEGGPAPRIRMVRSVPGALRC